MAAQELQARLAGIKTTTVSTKNGGDVVVPAEGNSLEDYIETFGESACINYIRRMARTDIINRANAITPSERVKLAKAEARLLNEAGNREKALELLLKAAGVKDIDL